MIYLLLWPIVGFLFYLTQFKKLIEVDLINVFFWFPVFILLGPLSFFIVALFSMDIG